MKIEYNPVYSKAFEFQGRYLNLYGSRGSGKSQFVGQKLLMRCLKEKNHLFLLVRKVHRTIKGSQLKLLKRLISEYKLNKYFTFYENEIKCINGNGFVTAGLDDAEKLKSMEGITGYWIEEATELTEEDCRNVDAVMRGKLPNYKQGILTYNPVDIEHWLNKVNLPGAMTLKTTYLDNKFIDTEYGQMLESLKEQNPDLYKVWALGEWGTRQDLIYVPFEKLDTYPAEFDEVIYGLDFGYNNETALIEVGIRDKEYYLTEKIYETKLTNTDLIDKLSRLITNKSLQIYADCAEPARIEEIARAGFNISPADKSVKDGIDFLKSLKIYSNYDNENLNNEVGSYYWKKDRNGKLLDEPVKMSDHLLDATRYAIYTHSKLGNIVPNIFVI